MRTRKVFLKIENQSCSIDINRRTEDVRDVLQKYGTQNRSRV